MPRFVVHEHHAERAGLHYDLRLELDGVLKSWAMRKEPPMSKGVKRLLILQPDHQLDYLNFEGVIPEGYGKGLVKIWDRGDYELLEREEDKLKVKFRGRKLRERYILIKIRIGWLFFKL